MVSMGTIPRTIAGPPRYAHLYRSAINQLHISHFLISEAGNHYSHQKWTETLEMRTPRAFITFPITSPCVHKKVTSLCTQYTLPVNQVI